ncbi:peroxiredoxin [Bradyrhizobium sp. i1.7.7]
MAIQTGDKLPEAKFRVMTAEGPQVKTTDDIFKGKKVALFAVPGAATPAPATRCICRASSSTPMP